MTRKHRKNVMTLWYAYDLYQRFQEREARAILIRLIQKVVKENPNG